MVVLSDFKTKSNSWHTNECMYIEGSKIDILTSTFGFSPNHKLSKPYFEQLFFIY